MRQKRKPLKHHQNYEVCQLLEIEEIIDIWTANQANFICNWYSAAH
jgi:hypothetical protein